MSQPDLQRFSGFADLYDDHRPSPPPRLGPLLARYAGVERPVVVDLGSGTGLSTRWAAGWAARVIGVEPNPEMRAVALARATHGTADVEYVDGSGHATGLPAGVADVVLAVQSMHWMEPASTHAEVARILRPGGVLAIVDADWPPVTGVIGAEQAWLDVHRRVRVLEARLARGVTGAALRQPVADDDPELADDDPSDPHRNRTMLGGRSWSKRDHLRRLGDSGRFDYTREVLLDHEVPGGATRYIDLSRSQGSYQTLLKAGLTDDEIGLTTFRTAVVAAFGAAGEPPTMSFCYRVRLGVTPR